MGRQWYQRRYMGAQSLIMSSFVMTRLRPMPLQQNGRPSAQLKRRRRKRRRTPRKIQKRRRKTKLMMTTMMKRTRKKQRICEGFAVRHCDDYEATLLSNFAV